MEGALIARPASDAAVDYEEPGIVSDPPATGETEEELLSRLTRYYEDAEQAQQAAREKAERDRDYVDNKQWTQEEVDKLAKRGQPAIALNVVRSRASFLGGMEKKQRRDPKAYPRNNPEDAPAAEAFTDGMRYVVERADYASKRSAAWKNITIEGFGGIELAATQGKDGSWNIAIHRIPWDRAFYDPHSSEPDFSDSRYFGQVLWMDYDEAMARALKGGQIDEARAKEVLDTTLAGSHAPGLGRTYDDKPRWQVWADSKRKRVRVVLMWRRDADGWKYCEFTQSGFLLNTPDSPYVDQDGESFCPWFFESANVDRENNRYGEIRHLIDPQDEINKRRSKALHQSVSRGVVASKGAVEDIAATRRELARPDFYIEVSPAAQKFEIVDGQELAAGQAQLLAQAMDYMMQAGPNAALLGKGTEDQSGRAIEAQQAGGLVEQSDLMDTLRRLDLRVFNGIASMMKQGWTAEKWVRVTDDDDTPRWVGFNQPMWTLMDTGETLPEAAWKQRLQQGEPIPVQHLVPAANENGPMLHNDMAQLDMDVMVSDAPSMITMDGEAYSALLDLLKSGLPPQVLKLAIEMHPSLPVKRKRQLIDMIDQIGQQAPSPGQQKLEELKVEQAEADVIETRATAYAALAAGEASLAKAGHFEPAQPPLPSLDGPGDMTRAPVAALPPPGAPSGPPQPAPGPAHPALPPPQAHAAPPPGPPPGPPQPAPQSGGGSGPNLMTGNGPLAA